MYVAGCTHIFENAVALKTIISSERLLYLEPGCRSRRNIIPSFQLSNGSDFMTALKYDKYSVEKLVPMMVDISNIATIIIVSYSLCSYIFFSQISSPTSSKSITRMDLRNIFGAHILSIADVVSDMGFIVTTCILWQGQDSGEKDQRVLVIGILSSIVVVGCQIFLTISLYVGLVHKFPGCSLPLIEILRGDDAMRRRDWLLLFPRFLVLETR